MEPLGVPNFAHSQFPACRPPRENLNLARQSYEAGDYAYLAVLTAQRSYAQAHLAWLNAVEQLWLATAQFEGLLLSNSLSDI